MIFVDRRLYHGLTMLLLLEGDTCIVHLPAPNTFWKRDIDLISKDRAIFITTETPFVFIKRGSVCYAKTETMNSNEFSTIVTNIRYLSPAGLI